jgi:uncharacterized protein YdhG (YjbR/CyaY superfamily)
MKTQNSPVLEISIIRLKKENRLVMKGSANDVDEYIANAPAEMQDKLRQLRAAIKQVAPGAFEGTSYKMPYYDYKGRLVWFALLKSNIGLYLRPPVIEQHRSELAKYRTTKSAINFPLAQELPIPLIKKLIKARMKMNEAEEDEKKIA